MDLSPLKFVGTRYRKTRNGVLQAVVISGGWVVKEIVGPNHFDWRIWAFIVFIWVFRVGMGFWHDRETYLKTPADAQET